MTRLDPPEKKIIPTYKKYCKFSFVREAKNKQRENKKKKKALSEMNISENAKSRALPTLNLF